MQQKDVLQKYFDIYSFFSMCNNASYDDPVNSFSNISIRISWFYSISWLVTSVACNLLICPIFNEIVKTPNRHVCTGLQKSWRLTCNKCRKHFLKWINLLIISFLKEQITIHLGNQLLFQYFLVSTQKKVITHDTYPCQKYDSCGNAMYKLFLISATNLWFTSQSM